MICERCGTVFCDESEYSPDADEPRRRYCSKTCRKKAQLSRKTAYIAGLVACQAKAKTPFPDIFTALQAAQRVSATYGTVQYPYYCPCGSWHLTRQTPGKGNP